LAGDRDLDRPQLGAADALARKLRLLQLALAGFWMFDGLLQLQPFMFTQLFGSEMLAPMAAGNRGFVAHSITWAAKFVTAHAELSNTGFAGIQLLIGVLIAWRPTVKVGLALSLPWSLAVWWVGEGLGRMATGEGSPLTGAPGAVLVYALLAVLLWPREEPPSRVSVPAPSGFGRVSQLSTGLVTARVLWVVLWLAMALTALLPFNRRSSAPDNLFKLAAVGQPAWLHGIQRHLANGLNGDGLVVAIALAAVLGIIAGVGFLPAGLQRPILAFAALLAVVIWAVGESFGGLLAGGPQTDPNSGAILLLLVVAYWPFADRVRDIEAVVV
jgi:hypothetical protein